MKILLIGAGAIGGSIAACLKKRNVDVTLVVKHDCYVKLIQEKGIHITGQKGDFIVKMPSFARIEEIQDTFDIIFIATKAYDVEEILKKITPLMKKNTSVVSLQNGICLDLYQNYVGEKHTVGCVVGFGATMNGFGNIKITSTGTLEIGKISDEFKGDLNAVQDCLSAVFTTNIVDNIYEFLYSKLIINSCITSLGAITGKPLGEMLKQKGIREIFIDIIKEAITVANKKQINVPPYGGKLDYYKIYRRNSKLGNWINHLIIKIVGKKYSQLKSSSLQSLERGQKTEIDYFNGYIERLGKSVGVPTPLNECLVQMVKELETGKRKPQMENVLDIQYK